MVLGGHTCVSSTWHLEVLIKCLMDEWREGHSFQDSSDQRSRGRKLVINPKTVLCRIRAGRQNLAELGGSGKA